MVKEKEIGFSDIDSGKIFNNGGGGGAGGRLYSYGLPINSAKFGLWLFISAIIMLFSAFTSAYIVRHSAGDWLRFKLPEIFWVNTLILVLSSVAIQLSYFQLKKDNLASFKALFLLSTLLGISFLIGQFIGWGQLKEMGIYVSTNPSSSFFYLLTIVHAVHLVGGIFALIYVLIRALFGHYSSGNRLGVELCITYWHFLDVLWVYLFVFINVMV